MVMSSQMLIVFALFVDRIQNGHHRNNGPVEEAMGVLTFFLFIAYGVFGMLLIVFHREIVEEGPSVSPSSVLVSSHLNRRRHDDGSERHSRSRRGRARRGSPSREYLDEQGSPRTVQCV
jgi:hypothetical protein